MKQTEAVQFQNLFNYLSPIDLDDVMEFLKDNKCLSPKGIDFRTEFWKTFIKAD